MRARSSIELGVPVDCDDGPAGKLRCVVNVGRGQVTHLIVELTHRHACARLVPVALVAPVARGDWGLLLTCTQAELDAQPPAVEAERHHLSGSASVTIPIADVATIEPDFVRLALGRDAVS